MDQQRTIQVAGYTRSVRVITVEFVCQRCQQAQVYQMYPGPRPKWCLACFPDVRKEQARQRKRQQRARQQQK
jgi:hypothetical protein